MGSPTLTSSKGPVSDVAEVMERPLDAPEGCQKKRANEGLGGWRAAAPQGTTVL